MKCCGVNGTGVGDFAGSKFQTSTKKTVPDACCKLGTDSKPKDLLKCQTDAKSTNLAKGKSEYLNNVGCKDELTQFITKNSAILLGVAGGVAGFELLVAVMAICFCCSIEEK